MVTASGTWWTLDDDGRMDITITGTMPDSDDGEYPPWRNIKSSIRSVYIHDGVTSIGKSAFEACENLAGLFISDTVTLIDESAFRYCYSLEGNVYYEGTLQQKIRTLQIKAHNDMLVSDDDGRDQPIICLGEPPDVQIQLNTATVTSASSDQIWVDRTAYEYKIENDSMDSGWQRGNTFYNLTWDTAYTVTARRRTWPFAEPGPESNPAEVRTWQESESDGGSGTGGSGTDPSSDSDPSPGGQTGNTAISYTGSSKVIRRLCNMVSAIYSGSSAIGGVTLRVIDGYICVDYGGGSNGNGQAD